MRCFIVANQINLDTEFHSNQYFTLLETFAATRSLQELLVEIWELLISNWQNLANLGSRAIKLL